MTWPPHWVTSDTPEYLLLRPRWPGSQGGVGVGRWALPSGTTGGGFPQTAFSPPRKTGAGARPGPHFFQMCKRGAGKTSKLLAEGHPTHFYQDSQPYLPSQCSLCRGLGAGQRRGRAVAAWDAGAHLPLTRVVLWCLGSGICVHDDRRGAQTPQSWWGVLIFHLDEIFSSQMRREGLSSQLMVSPTLQSQAGGTWPPSPSDAFLMIRDRVWKEGSKGWVPS